MIDQIGERCTGCYACLSACPKNSIQMIENQEGFWFPRIDSATCVRCNLCEKACPILNKKPNGKTGADVRAYAIVHKDSEVRRKSSSGGAFSALASAVLRQGGVVFGAAFDENFDVRHIAVTEEKELGRLRGSKYVQSRIGDCYVQAKQYLDAGRMVYFSGTACQTSGLIGYLGRDDPNLLTQDLICHGVPSPMAWRKYIALREKLARSKTKKIFFRDKTYGWHNWHLAFSFQNGEEYKQSQLSDMMIVSFLRGKISRPCCYACDFKDRYRQADFTLADYWGVEKLMPELDDDKGVSVCFVNSEKGRRLLEKVSETAALYEVNPDSAVEANLAMIESESLPADRGSFLRELRRHSFDMVAGKHNEEIKMRTKIRWTLRRVLGSQRYEALFHKKEK